MTSMEREKDPPQGRRELSCFFAKELFSLHLEGQLDNDRKSQIERHLKSCSACELQFEKFKRSREVISELASVKPTKTLVTYLRREHHFWTDFFEQAGWKKWPASLKWATELSTFAVVLAVIIHFLPWLGIVKSIGKMNSHGPVNVIAAHGPEGKQLPDSVDTDGIEKSVALPPAGVGVSSKPVTPVSNSKKVKVAAASKRVTTQKVVDPDEDSVPPPVPSGAEAQDVGQDDDQEAPQVASAETTNAAKPPQVATPTAGAQTDSDTAAEEAQPTAAAAADAGEGDSTKESGWVWKGTLKVDDVTDDLTDQVTKTIRDLGGVKAGQVELGWHRGNQRYYHFILPEENYNKLLRDLNGLGIVELSKMPHPRVIKEGHMRIIMTVEVAE